MVVSSNPAGRRPRGVARDLSQTPWLVNKSAGGPPFNIKSEHDLEVLSRIVRPIRFGRSPNTLRPDEMHNGAFPMLSGDE